MAAVAALALIAMAVPLLWSSPDMLLTSAAAERELQADEGLKGYWKSLDAKAARTAAVVKSLQEQRFRLGEGTAYESQRAQSYFNDHAARVATATFPKHDTALAGPGAAHGTVRGNAGAQERSSEDSFFDELPRKDVGVETWQEANRRAEHRQWTLRNREQRSARSEAAPIDDFWDQRVKEDIAKGRRHGVMAMSAKHDAILAKSMQEIKNEWSTMTSPVEPAAVAEPGMAELQRHMAAQRRAFPPKKYAWYPNDVESARAKAGMDKATWDQPKGAKPPKAPVKAAVIASAAEDTAAFFVDAASGDKASAAAGGAAPTKAAVAKPAAEVTHTAVAGHAGAVTANASPKAVGKDAGAAEGHAAVAVPKAVETKELQHRAEVSKPATLTEAVEGSVKHAVASVRPASAPAKFAAAPGGKHAAASVAVARTAAAAQPKAMQAQAKQAQHREVASKLAHAASGEVHSIKAAAGGAVDASNKAPEAGLLPTGFDKDADAVLEDTDIGAKAAEAAATDVLRDVAASTSIVERVVTPFLQGPPKAPRAAAAAHGDVASSKKAIPTTVDAAAAATAAKPDALAAARASAPPRAGPAEEAGKRGAVAKLEGGANKVFAAQFAARRAAPVRKLQRYMGHMAVQTAAEGQMGEDLGGLVTEAFGGDKPMKAGASKYGKYGYVSSAIGRPSAAVVAAERRVEERERAEETKASEERVEKQEREAKMPVTGLGEVRQAARGASLPSEAFDNLMFGKPLAHRAAPSAAKARELVRELEHPGDEGYVVGGKDSLFSDDDEAPSKGGPVDVTSLFGGEASVGGKGLIAKGRIEGLAQVPRGVAKAKLLRETGGEARGDVDSFFDSLARRDKTYDAVYAKGDETRPSRLDESKGVRESAADSSDAVDTKRDDGFFDSMAAADRTKEARGRRRELEVNKAAALKPLVMHEARLSPKHAAETEAERAKREWGFAMRSPRHKGPATKAAFRGRGKGKGRGVSHEVASAAQRAKTVKKQEEGWGVLLDPMGLFK